MTHDFLDRYSRLRSPIHRLPAGVKLGGAVGLVVATVTVPIDCGWFFIGAAVGLIAIAALSTVPPRFLLKRLLFLEPFVLGIALLTLLQPNGGRLFLTIVVRSSLCLLTMILLSATTPFADLLRVLRRIHTPALLITTLALMYRYLFVLVDEGQRMRRARASRTFAAGRWRAWRSLSSVVGQLFVRSSERAERIYAAMCARGWR